MESVDVEYNEKTERTRVREKETEREGERERRRSDRIGEQQSAGKPCESYITKAALTVITMH